MRLNDNLEDDERQVLNNFFCMEVFFGHLHSHFLHQMLKILRLPILDKKIY